MYFNSNRMKKSIYTHCVLLIPIQLISVDSTLVWRKLCGINDCEIGCTCEIHKRLSVVSGCFH